MMTQAQALVQEIGERMKAADLIESRQLLQYSNSLKTDYLSKQPLLPKKKDYLEVAHLFPERPWYGGMNNWGKSGSGQLRSDGYLSGRGEKGKNSINMLLQNEYSVPMILNREDKGTYLPVNRLGTRYGNLWKD